MDNQLREKDKCCGCAACTAVCQYGAIRMVRDTKNGFFYPEIDASKCVSCGRCVEICRNRRFESDYPSKVFAAINEDNLARKRAASGAIFEALAKNALERNWAVAGVLFSQNLRKAEHVLIEDEKDLPGLCGTKYFQSSMDNIYGDILKACKKEGKRVLFCGTPCQVNAVKKFSISEGIIDNIYLVDLLCRGIPSPLSWEKYIEDLEKKSGKKVKSIKVKDKERGWNKVGTMICFDDDTTLYESVTDTYFGKLFLCTNLSVRESCFNCDFKSIHREGDITIGDFWGLRNSHLLDGNMGTSLMMVNSEKGEKLLEQMSNDIKIEPSTMLRATRNNDLAFSKIFGDKKQREEFWELLANGFSLEEAYNKIIKDDEN